MSEASADHEAALAALTRRITEAEMRSTAAAQGLSALAKTEADTAEAEQQLDQQMDTLLDLRRRLWELRSLEGE